MPLARARRVALPFQGLGLCMLSAARGNLRSASTRADTSLLPKRPFRSARAAISAMTMLALSSGAALANDPLSRTIAACATPQASFAGLIAAQKANGWTEIAPSDLTDQQVALLSLRDALNFFDPTKPLAKQLGAKRAVETLVRNAPGVRALKPMQGPQFYKTFLTRGDAVLTLERQGAGKRVMILCQAYLPMKTGPTDGKLYRTAVNQTPGGGTLRISTVETAPLYALLDDTPTIKAPDHLGLVVFFTLVDAEQVKP